jgi:hypothetical protein
MTITQLGQKFTEAQIITGTNIGDKIFIPRIIMSPNDAKWPFRLKRMQFPLLVCFAMTINKSQGKSLQKVGLYLSKLVFCHLQLYVTLSRVTNIDGLKILIDGDGKSDENVPRKLCTKKYFKQKV